ncbi:uncharacterized protein FIBRA_02303 [Fibroporia radiculosa]|uniref:Uncharacterized protein n=1 Tax=Fibroporia radiculosa TaxID=599839 RepID=J4G1K2_9APHY|nr:uncharacterized protein FIBRA_02303 [Fibroporia radiculosa]CCM00273.1 predicted protein [Fibroporia radiculosa]
MSDGVPPGQVEESQNALDIALSAPSLIDCFAMFEEADLRRKFAYATGVSGWDRTVLAVLLEDHTAPVICLAWTHRSIPLSTTKCWILDVTSDPVSDVKRWVVANGFGPKLRKIGTVRSYPALVEDKPTRIRDVVFV